MAANWRLAPSLCCQAETGRAGAFRGSGLKENVQGQVTGDYSD